MASTTTTPSEQPATPILIVDDDAFLLDMYARKFSQAGYAVTPASGTGDALEKLRGGFEPEILLTDLVMPGMDGFEFLEAMQKEGLAKGAFKMVLSNLGQEEDVKRATEFGARGYIIKASATPSEVLEQVKTAYAQARGA